jgi:hypothetical protein
MKSILALILILNSYVILAGGVDASRVKSQKDSSYTNFSTAIHLGGGYSFFSGDMVQYQNGFKQFNIDVNFSYYRYNFGMNAYTGGEKTKKEIATKEYSIGNDTTNFIGCTEFFFGYEFIHSKRWIVNPTIGFNVFQMGHTNTEVDENDSPPKIGLDLGLDLSYKFWTKKTKNGETLGLMLKHRTSWSHFKYNSQLGGQFLNQQLALGFFVY